MALHRDVDGVVHTVTSTGGEAVINPPGVWHRSGPRAVHHVRQGHRGPPPLKSGSVVAPIAPVAGRLPSSLVPPIGCSVYGTASLTVKFSVVRAPGVTVTTMGWVVDSLTPTPLPNTSTKPETHQVPGWSASW